MMHARIFAFVIVAFLGLGPVAAQELPLIVQQNLQTMVKDCGGKLDVARKSVQSIDLNEDGVPDFVLDAGKLGCEMPSYYCGSAGCTLVIFASHNGTHSIVWENNAHRWKPMKVRGKPGLHFDLHGSACQRVGSAPCSQRYYFQGSRLVGVK
jgi:hypothetical protein